MCKESHSRELMMAAPRGIYPKSQHLGLRQEVGSSRSSWAPRDPGTGEGLSFKIFMDITVLLAFTS